MIQNPFSTPIHSGQTVTVNYSPVIDARGADQAAVDRLERNQRQIAAEFKPRVYEAMRDANRRGIDRAWRR